VTDDEYRARLAAIEAAANTKYEATLAAFPVRFPARRSVRYREIGRAIAAAAIEHERVRIAEEMHEQLEALDREYYAPLLEEC